ncbi:CsgG/HfaB family protein [Gemmatimonas phototrophica]|uniref:CsgG/HfaB family protein n=1 Tax=Gemmatimonas phototrophica TaxID=1379270 RepID=UPI0005BAE141|nr:CsgG/HfaB family protein [Gemmatimonas phototrophica]
MTMRPLRISAHRSPHWPVAVPVLAWLLGACSSARPTPGPVSAADSARVAALAAEQGGTAVRGTVGIPPFATVGNRDTTLTQLAYALADLVSTDLSRSKQVKVVERARFSEVLRELNLASTGRVDSATAPRVGRLVSAERLVFGSVQSMPDGRTLRLGARVGDVERSTLSRPIDASAPLAEILAAEKALVLRLFESLGVQLTPAERAEVEQQPTKSIGALLAYGRGVQRYYEGDFKGASRSFRDATRLDPNFRAARSRELNVRSLSAIGTATPVMIPGVRAIDGAISSTIDRLNRPLDLVTNVSRAVSTTLDPSFPTSQSGTIIITIIKP